LAAWASFISAALGLLAGGVATYFTTRAQLRVEVEHAYDHSLRGAWLSLVLLAQSRATGCKAFLDTWRGVKAFFKRPPAAASC
jgi:hypothetical protein